MKRINSICHDKHQVLDKFRDLNISMPAKRALEREGINSVQELAGFSEEQLLSLHGLGKTAIPQIKQDLRTLGLELKK